MMRRLLAVFAFFLLPALRAQDSECVGSVAITSFRLAASPAGAGSPVWMPVRQLNNLPAGYRVRYQPGMVPADLDKEAAVALVLVPTSGDGQLNVLQPGPAAVSSDWIVPFDTKIVVLVFAPQGLDQKRLTNLISRDPALISAMAEYAEQTNELEETLEALRRLDDDTEAALEPGRASTPTEQALLALVRALNPSVSSYDPLGAGRRAGPTNMMGRGASMFFENAGSVVPGGGILPTVKQFLMPDTEFRSVYGTGAPSGSMTLCAQRQPRGNRSKLAYVWAYRLSTAQPPQGEIAGAERAVDAAIGLRAEIPIRVPHGSNWDLLERVTDWGLVAPTGGAPLHVPAHFSSTTRSLRLDLRNFAGAPAEYEIEGRWDWSALRVNGKVRLHALDDLNAAVITPDSQSLLVANTGPVALNLTGANLRFVTQAWLHRAESERRIAVDLPSKHGGDPDRLRVELDTDGLHPGPYQLALRRIDGAAADIPVRILAEPPVIESEAVRVNLGEDSQTVLLTGTGLDAIDQLESPRASIELLPATQKGTRRAAIVRLRPGVAIGESLALSAKAGLGRVLNFPGVLQVAAARPRIVEARAAQPTDLPIALKAGELPAGSFTGVTLRMESPDQATLKLNCEGAPADRAVRQTYTPSGEGTIYFSFDPGTVGPATIGSTGCKLTAAIENTDAPLSDPFPLGTVVRVPRIDKLTHTKESAPGGYVAVLEGWDLETIDRAGWSATMGLPAADPPRPIAGQGAKQTLRIAMPWPSPSPKAPLFVWLRGESQGRATGVTP
jgi:hypothetical protein